MEILRAHIHIYTGLYAYAYDKYSISNDYFQKKYITYSLQAITEVFVLYLKILSCYR